MIHRRQALLTGAAAVLAGSAAAAETPADLDARLAPIARLLGRWSGTGDGEPGVSTVERTIRAGPGGRFLIARNVSTYAPQPKNPKGERHEDEGYYSFDRARGVFVFRQFHGEGFVNQYVAKPPAASPLAEIVFESEAIENIPSGYRARETYRFPSADEFVEVFEVAEPGQAFAVYSTNRLRRVG